MQMGFIRAAGMQRVEQQLRALQHQHAGGLGHQTIGADIDPDPPERQIHHRIATAPAAGPHPLPAEDDLLLVLEHDAAIRRQDDAGDEGLIALTLDQAGRDMAAMTLGALGQRIGERPRHAAAMLQGFFQRTHHAARPIRHLRQHHQRRTVLGRLVDQAQAMRQIARRIRHQRNLQAGHANSLGLGRANDAVAGHGSAGHGSTGYRSTGHARSNSKKLN